VNVASSKDLPPPEELKDLPLDVLIDILTSARPLHEALRSYLKRKNILSKDGSTESVFVVDPHKRVDTSGFLLQRTRRFSLALTGLRSRLERPVPTEECLQWRIYGPVGVIAIATALDSKDRSNDEKSFLIAELALELLRVEPQTNPGGISAQKIRDELKKAVALLRNFLTLTEDDTQSNLCKYLDQVKQKIDES
jgi:hypothetical protein